MLLFHNDYNEVCHPAVMDKITSLSGHQMPGYGMDPCCERAAGFIRKHCENDDLSVHFLVGGTQTNLIVIAASLRPHQAVLSAYSGHINVHETGAIEATGHKIISVTSDDGKLTAEQVEKFAHEQTCDENAEHVAQIKMVYISQSTELGTLYSLSELERISAVCKKYGLYLFVDGARLGYALTARYNDVTLADMARLCDVFYIGGTKCGTMFGEAVVIANKAIAEDFRYLIKQHGAMLAKGWLLGAQFEAMFEDGLYFDICRHANKMADQLRDTLSQLGYPLFIQGSSNQVFPVLPNELLDKISEYCTFMVQEVVDETHKAVRFCTSWATTQRSMDTLCSLLRKYS